MECLQIKMNQTENIFWYCIIIEIYLSFLGSTCKRTRGPWSRQSESLGCLRYHFVNMMCDVSDFFFFYPFVNMFCKPVVWCLRLAPLAIMNLVYGVLEIEQKTIGVLCYLVWTWCMILVIMFRTCELYVCDR